MNARGIDFTGIAYLGALIVGGVVVYQLVKSGGKVGAAVSGAVETVKAAAGAAVDAVNPTNENNIFNRLIGKPLAEIFVKGGNPDERTNGSALLSRFTAIDQEDADIGAAMRALQRRPDLIASPGDIEDAENGFNMAAMAGYPVTANAKLGKGVFK